MNNLGAPIRNIKKIKTLLPHREPMIMVDALVYVDDEKSVSELTILDTNIFVNSGVFSEAGLLEHMAQTAALQSGYKNYLNGTNPRLGYIIAINKATIVKLPKLEETISSEIRTEFESESIRKIQVTSRLNKNVISEATMTIVLKGEDGQ